VLAPLCAAPTAAQDNLFQNHYEPTTGRVGYHMVSQPHPDRMPPGCSPVVNGVTLEAGTLPPGLAGPTYSVAMGLPAGVIEGTPRQPGDWQVVIVLHNVTCGVGGTPYGDRRVNVNFHIDP
jgi:hypothetical protein